MVHGKGDVIVVPGLQLVVLWDGSLLLTHHCKLRCFSFTLQLPLPVIESLFLAHYMTKFAFLSVIEKDGSLLFFNVSSVCKAIFTEIR
jgi:hypothetical protein